MFSINKNLLKIKIIYFATFAGLSPLTAFGPTIAKQLGFSAAAVGLMYSVSIILSIFGRLIFGYLADKFRILKQLLITTIFVCSCSILLTALFPQPELPKIYLISGESSSSFKICFANRADINGLFFKNANNYEVCEIYCGKKVYATSFSKNRHRTEGNSSFNEVYIGTFTNETSNVCIDGYKNHELFIEKTANNLTCSLQCNLEKESFKEEFTQPLFWLFFGTFALYFVTNCVIGVFIDTICFQTLDNEGGKFGNQRMFASMGWGTAALCSGILTDYFSYGENLKNYVPTFILAFAYLTCAGVMLIFFTMPVVEVTTKIDLAVLSRILMNGKSLIFACWCLLSGVYSAVVWQYSFWIIEEISTQEELIWNKSLQGITVVVNTMLGDVPTYYFFSEIFAKLGYVHCMTLSLFLNAIRLLAYSLLNTPIWALVISMLDGLTFGVTYATIASYSNLISSVDSKTTVQATFNSIFDGIGTSIGGLCFGFVYDWYGGAYSFRLGSIIAFLNAFLHIMISRFVMKDPL